MKKLLVILVFSILFAGGATMSTAQEVQPGIQTLCSAVLPASNSFWRPLSIPKLGEQVSVSKNEKETIQYWAFIPTDESARTADGFPLLIFLHGAGEVGPDPQKVKVHGPPKLLDTDQAKSWPFLTVSPQCTNGKYWSPEQLLLLFDEIEKKFPVDKKRIYVTGLSMGGFATWMLLSIAPDRFAAAVPVCGGGDPKNADKFVNIPIWIFHGGADSVVNPKYSYDFNDAIKKAGGKKCQLTIYPNVNHDSWTKTYANPKLYQWLLQQKK